MEPNSFVVALLGLLLVSYVSAGIVQSCLRLPAASLGVQRPSIAAVHEESDRMDPAFSDARRPSLEDLPIDALLPQLDSFSLLQLARASHGFGTSVRRFAPALDSMGSLRQRLNHDCGVCFTHRFLQMRYATNVHEPEYARPFLSGEFVQRLRDVGECQRAVISFCQQADTSKQQGSAGISRHPLRLQYGAVRASDVVGVLETFQPVHDACTVKLDMYVHAWSDTQSLEQLQTLATVMRTNTALAFLSLGGLNLNNVDAMAWLELMLAESGTLCAFSIAYSRLEPWHLRRLFAGLQKNPRILSVAFHSNMMHAHSINTLGQLLTNVPWLRRLSLRSNTVFHSGLETIHDFWEFLRCPSTSLVSLELIDCNLGAEDMYHLGLALRENTHLQELVLTGNKGIPAKAIARWMKSIAWSSSALWRLVLSDMDLGEDAVNAVAQFLRYTRICELDLSGNELSRRSCLYNLMVSLKKNRNLQVLHLQNVGMGRLDAYQISLRLEKVPYLKRLYLDRNQLDRSCAFLLAKGLRENHSLEELSITGNQIDVWGVEALMRGMKAVKDGKDNAWMQRWMLMNGFPTAAMPSSCALKRLSAWGNKLNELERTALAEIPIAAGKRVLLDPEPLSPLHGTTVIAAESDSAYL